MVRKLSPSNQNVINERTGLEPANVIRIQWVAGGGFHYYSDRYINPTVAGKLISLDGLESIIDITKGASSIDVKVTLSDLPDGYIKKIFDSHDIHTRPVNIYQWFTQVPLGEMFLIFEGAIASPIEWDEGSRVISFSVISKLYDIEAGFSVEDGQFINVPQNIIGKNWPMVFGTVLHMPTVQMDVIPTGTTLTPIGIPDANLSGQGKYLGGQAGSQAAKAACISLRGAELMFAASFEGGGLDMFARGQAMQRQAEGMYGHINNKIVPQMNRMAAIFGSQASYDQSSVQILNGHLFHQGVNLELEINGAHYTGAFNGDTFNITSRKSPTESLYLTPFGTSGAGGVVDNNATGPIIGGSQDDADKRYADFLFNPGGITVADLGLDTDAESTAAYWACDPPYFYAGGVAAAAGGGSDNNVPGQFFFIPPGTSVNVGRNYSLRYIITIVPGTEVLWLGARKAVNGVKVITPIPSQYYTLSEERYGPVTALIATFAAPLSTLIFDQSSPYVNQNQQWEDDIFASLRSPIGPNVVDILIYLIQKFTHRAIDSVSFNHVRSKVENYPANFALLEKKNIVEFLKEIAWQARCALWVNDNTFYIKYLPEKGTAVDTITEDDIEQKTLVISSTNTEELVTKMIASWTPDYSLPNPYKIIMSYNLAKYGKYEQEINFYIYNSAELVIKSMTFWLIRMSNVWKIMKCKCFLNRLKLETFDDVTINLAQNYASKGPVLGNVQKATFNSNDFSIDLEIWLPIRLGEMTTHQFAYPSVLPVTQQFPPVQELSGGFIYPTIYDGAGGNLGSGNGGYGVATGSQIGGKGGTNFPSDNYDTPQHGMPPKVDTTMTGPAAPGAHIAPVGSTPGTRAPAYDYRFDRVDPQRVLPEQPIASQSTPAYIVSGEGGTYTVNSFPSGIFNNSVSVNKVSIPGLPNDILMPANTWGVLIRSLSGSGAKAVAIYQFIPAGLWTSEEDEGF